jgi:glycosyltransferase involved in cell wall biosynthesis
MTRGLMLSHLRNTRYLHGGYVYRDAIKQMLLVNDPGLTMDEISVHDQHHRAWRLCRQVGDILSSPFSLFPAKVNHFRTRAFRQRMAAAFANNGYGLVVISGADMLWCLDALPPRVPLLYISHNIEHLLYNQQVARYAGLPGLGPLLRADAAKFKAFELERLKRVRHIITIADPDREALQAYAPEARIVTIMPSFAYVPYAKRRFDDEAPLRLGFLGNLEWWPNRRSLTWFLDQVFPQVSARVELHLFGQGSGQLSDGARVLGHGFVQDLAQVFGQVDMMIQPITCGGGVNIKVAEALYNRMPVLATPLALRGMTLHADPAIRVLAEPGEWVEYLNGPHPLLQAGMAVRQENSELFSLARNALALKELVAIAKDGAGR